MVTIEIFECFKYGNSLPQNDSVALDNIKQYQGLETANFDIVALNNMGEAVYDPDVLITHLQLL